MPTTPYTRKACADAAYSTEITSAAEYEEFIETKNDHSWHVAQLVYADYDIIDHTWIYSITSAIQAEFW